MGILLCCLEKQISEKNESFGPIIFESNRGERLARPKTATGIRRTNTRSLGKENCGSRFRTQQRAKDLHAATGIGRPNTRSTGKENCGSRSRTRNLQLLSMSRQQFPTSRTKQTKRKGPLSPCTCDARSRNTAPGSSGAILAPGQESNY